MELTMKQQAFVDEYIENGGNASAAYRSAYNAERMKPETIWVKASELLSSGNVSVRVDLLRSEIAARCAVTVDSITAELDESRAMALEDRNPHAATQASMGKAKLAGLLEDKINIKGKITAESGMDYLSAKYNVDIQKLIEESDREKEISQG